MSYYKSQFANVTKPLLGTAVPSLLRVFVQHHPPLVIVDPTKTGSARYSGAFIDLLPVLLKYASVDKTSSWELYDTTHYSLDNATYTNSSKPAEPLELAVRAELNSGFADIGLFPFPVTSSTASYVDVTTPIFDNGLAVMVISEQSGLTSDIFLQPFSLQLWVVLLMTMLAVPLLLMGLEHLCRLGQSAYEASTQPRNRSTHFLEVWLCYTNNTKVPRQGSWSLQLAYVVLCLFCFIFTQLYQAQLNSLLTQNRITSSITGIADVYSGGYMFGVVSGSVAQSYFINSHDFLARSMRDNMQVYSDMDSSLVDLRANKISAILDYRMFLQVAISNSATCDLAVVGADFTPGNIALGVPRNSSLTFRLGLGILQARELGDANAILRPWLNARTCPSTVMASASTFALDVTDVLYPYMVLVLVLGSAFIWVSTEAVLVYLCARDPRLHGISAKRMFWPRRPSAVSPLEQAQSARDPYAQSLPSPGPQAGPNPAAGLLLFPLRSPAASTPPSGSASPAPAADRGDSPMVRSKLEARGSSDRDAETRVEGRAQEQDALEALEQAVRDLADRAESAGGIGRHVGSNDSLTGEVQVFTCDDAPGPALLLEEKGAADGAGATAGTAKPEMTVIDL